jgi:hypothetical protein
VIRYRRSVTGCRCAHRKEPLAVSIVIKIEQAAPELTFNGAPEDVARMTAWLEARPELNRLVFDAEELTRAGEAA